MQTAEEALRPRPGRPAQPQAETEDAAAARTGALQVEEGFPGSAEGRSPAGYHIVSHLIRIETKLYFK